MHLHKRFYLLRFLILSPLHSYPFLLFQFQPQGSLIMYPASNYFAGGRTAQWQFRYLLWLLWFPLTYAKLYAMRLCVDFHQPFLLFRNAMCAKGNAERVIYCAWQILQNGP